MRDRWNRRRVFGVSLLMILSRQTLGLGTSRQTLTSSFLCDVTSTMNTAEQATTFPTPRGPVTGPPYPNRSLPQPIGPYRIEREIGRGGMGHVYLAVRNDRAYQKRVAIKVLGGSHHARALEWRFKCERQILAGLDHPNIARLLDGGTTHDGRPYFVMDHIQGQRIDHYCDAQRLTVRERLELFLQVCDAVQYAHRNLVVHRDIKPSNLLVTPDGVPKLLDFGIAKLLNPSLQWAANEETVTGQHPMTPKYASPEQIRGQAISTASDVYSLGVLLYKLLTGRVPRLPKANEPLDRMLDDELTSPSEAIDPAAALPMLTRDDSDSEGVALPETLAKLRRTSLSALRQQLAGDLDRIALMALRQEPERRYGSAQELADDIRRHLEGRPVSARPDTLGYRFHKFFERHRWAVGACAVAALVIFTLSGVMLHQTRQATEEAQASAARYEQVRVEHQRAQVERDRSETLAQLLLDSVVQERADDPAEAQAILQRTLQHLESSDLPQADQQALRQRLEAAGRQLPTTASAEPNGPLRLATSGQMLPPV